MENNSIAGLIVIYEGLWSDPVAQAFIGLIIVCLVVGILLVRVPGTKARKIVSIMPSALTKLALLEVSS